MTRLRRRQRTRAHCDRVRHALGRDARGVMLLIDWGDGMIDASINADAGSPLHDEADELEQEAKRVGKWKGD